MRSRILAPVFVMIGLLLTACGTSSSSTRTITESAAASTTTGATATSTTQPGSGTVTSTTLSANSTPPATEKEVADDKEKAEEDLTVNPGDIILAQLPERARCDADDSAIIIPVEVREGDHDYRQFTDAVELPFKNGLSVESNLDEVFERNCRNVVFLDMNIQGISTIELPWGYRPVEHMSWMGNWLGKAEAKPLTQFLVKRNGVLYPSAEMRMRAEYVNAIILQGSASIDPDGQSSENWHLPVMEPGELNRTVKNGAQEALPNLRLTFIYKAIGCVESVGWNLLDKRFEIFSDCQQAPTPPTTSCPNCGPPPSPTPPTTSCPNCGPTTTTPVPTTTAPCVPPNRDDSGKCVPPTTVAPSTDTTVAPTTPTTQPGSPTTVAAGQGATNTSAPPTTVASAPAPPTTATPVTNVPPPSDG